MAFDLEIPKDWEEHWRDMPEMRRRMNNPVQSITVNFSREEDVAAFGLLVGRKLSTKTTSIWWPNKYRHDRTPPGTFVDEEDLEEKE